METLLKQCGLKKTGTREKIIAALSKAKAPLTADEIYRNCQGVNLSTVYRTVNAFYVEGLLNKEINNDGTASFSLIKEEHKHVLVCTKCHKRVYIDECPYKEANQEILDKTGFSVTNEHTEIYGVCESCRKKEK